MPATIADRKSPSKAVVVAVAVFLAIQLFTATTVAHAQTYTLVYSFPQNAAGYAPLAPLIRNAEGDLLGTATAGGHFWGTLFKLKADGSMKVLHYFDRADGATPIGQLARDAEGNFYGTTSAGGSSFVGTIYKMDQSNNFTKLFQFHQFVGYSPWGGLTIDSAGNLYGTNTAGGGPGTSANEGDVFELSSAGTYTVLHHFLAHTNDGAAPNSSLLRDSLGILYGTTPLGGNYNCTSGCGTVFRIGATRVEIVIHRFAGAPNDGANPYAGLIRDHAGNFYGTTYAGGTADLGTVFKIDTTGAETVLYSFQGGTDGSHPWAPVAMDASGNLYGTTSEGGSLNTLICGSGCGTVFKLDGSGNETVVHSFEGPDGDMPLAGLILGSDGNFYGTTTHGGTAGAGTIFKITP